jgi:hypothetical protein
MSRKELQSILADINSPPQTKLRARLAMRKLDPTLPQAKPDSQATSKPAISKGVDPIGSTYGQFLGGMFERAKELLTTPGGGYYPTPESEDVSAVESSALPPPGGEVPAGASSAPELIGPPAPGQTRMAPGEGGLAPPSLVPESPPPEAADTTLEIGMFKALLEAPAPEFQKAAFSPTENLFLGLLAGLRGYEATLPFIEQRREDARIVYEQARHARAEKLGGLFNLAQVAESNRRMKEQQAHQTRLEKMRQKGAVERAGLMAGMRFPPGYAAAQKERRDLVNLRSAVRRARGIVDKFPGITGPLDQFLWMHPTSEGREALRQLDVLFSTITSTMATTESGGKNLTETELQIFGGRFPLISNLGGTVAIRLRTGEEWFSQRIASLERDFPTMGYGQGNLFPGGPVPPPPNGFTSVGDWQLGDDFDESAFAEENF